MSATTKYLKGIDEKKEVLVKEVYSRKVGLELEKMNLPNTIVKESQKKRSVSNLLRKYRAKWLLDLHDPGRLYNPRNDDNMTGGKMLADVGIFPYYAKNRMEDLEDNLRKFVMKKYNITDWRNTPVGVYDIPYEHYNSRYLAVELLTGHSKKESIDFVKSLSEYLQTL